ncbi:hypothetical protein SNOG_16216 [Parastagonospora nodorum SN15]|uniref:Uncharacterized protein n=1 Tax=Phaeosphaeria nodorum (strain SN15 / ATCC MYA-4574 / FGSC 10173) TaxID=321614 RepID=Q0TW95_PHANO|nr:hypothetical protein SNOG_16216 [Parastagonospora nodorum SN15]EAT76400.1 hypothetical protein SNOG_16216 [Parastagonospora nodorum SN15]
MSRRASQLAQHSGAHYCPISIKDSPAALDNYPKTPAHIATPIA